MFEENLIGKAEIIEIIVTLIVIYGLKDDKYKLHIILTIAMLYSVFFNAFFDIVAPERSGFGGISIVNTIVFILLFCCAGYFVKKFPDKNKLIAIIYFSIGLIGVAMCGSIDNFYEELGYTILCFMAFPFWTGVLAGNISIVVLILFALGILSMLKKKNTASEETDFVSNSNDLENSNDLDPKCNQQDESDN